jgi:DNA ligase-1
MSKTGEPDVDFYGFDCVDAPQSGFQMRLTDVFLRAKGQERVVPVAHESISTVEALNVYEARAVSQGWEGIMLRDPHGLYKHGRSTAKEGGLLKVKRFADAEAEIVGFEERMHNDNPAKFDALGHVERSTAKAGKVPAGDLGALLVQSAQFPKPFAIGAGFTAEQRADFWTARSVLIGQQVKFKFQPVGTVDAPRFPVFLGFRPEGA